MWADDVEIDAALAPPDAGVETLDAVDVNAVDHESLRVRDVLVIVVEAELTPMGAAVRDELRSWAHRQIDDPDRLVFAFKHERT